MMAVPCWSSWKTGMFMVFLQFFLDVEALRRLDVLQVDAAEGRLQKLDRADDLVRILGVHLDVEDVHVGEALEEDALALHDRLAGQSADVAKTKDGSAVGDHRHQITFGGVQIGVFRRLLNCQTGFGNAGGISQ